MGMDQIFRASGMLKSLEAVTMDLSTRGRQAAAQMLNDVAFQYRKDAPQVIGEHRQIRDKRFIQSRFLVDKCAPGPINSLVAVAGSIQSERFSGFAEDYGETPSGLNKRGMRSEGANSRGGDMANRAVQTNRLLPDTTFPKLDDFADIRGDTNQRMAAMISMIARHPSIVAQTKGLFMLQGGDMRAGVYMIKAGAPGRIKHTKTGRLRLAMGDTTNAANSDTYSPAITRIITLKQDIRKRKLDWAHIAHSRTMAKALDIWARSFARYFK